MSNPSYNIIHYGGDNSCSPEAYKETLGIPTLEEAIELGNELIKEGFRNASLEISNWIEGFYVIDANLDELVYTSPVFGFEDLVNQAEPVYLSTFRYYNLVGKPQLTHKLLREVQLNQLSGELHDGHWIHEINFENNSLKLVHFEKRQSL